jgi:TPP-dependent indolepyruvate ferredoxin oxidoreductase alpha subunit
MLSVRRIPSLWEVDDLFRRSFEELGLPHPVPEEYLRRHARDVAEVVVAGNLDPLEGARILNTLAEALDQSQDLAPWTGFDEDLFLVVGADGRTLY